VSPETPDVPGSDVWQPSDLVNWRRSPTELPRACTRDLRDIRKRRDSSGSRKFCRDVPTVMPQLYLLAMGDAKLCIVTNEGWRMSGNALAVWAKLIAWMF